MLLWLCTYVSHKCQVSNISIGQMNLPNEHCVIAKACPWQFTSRRQLAQLWTHESMRIYEDRITSEAGHESHDRYPVEGETSFVSCANGIGFLWDNKKMDLLEIMFWVRSRHRPQPTLRYDFFSFLLVTWRRGCVLITWHRGARSLVGYFQWSPLMNDGSINITKNGIFNGLLGLDFPSFPSGWLRQNPCSKKMPILSN